MRTGAARQPHARLWRLVRMPAWERRLTLEALAAVGCARLAVRVLPFRTTLELARRLEAGMRRYPVLRAASAHADGVTLAVARAGRVIPGATCLPQALAGYVLFSRHQAPVVLRIGVRKDQERGLEAHAWLERAGNVVLGGPGTDAFAPFAPLASRPTGPARDALQGQGARQAWARRAGSSQRPG